MSYVLRWSAGAGRCGKLRIPSQSDDFSMAKRLQGLLWLERISFLLALGYTRHSRKHFVSATWRACCRRLNNSTTSAFAQIAMMTQHSTLMASSGTALASPDLATVPLFGAVPHEQLLIIPGVSTSLNITVRSPQSHLFCKLATLKAFSTALRD